LKSNEIQLKKKGMEIVAQCIENMLITAMSMVFEKYIYNSKKTQIRKGVHLFIPFKSSSKTKSILA
jgi:hypothetical protein